MKTEPPLASEVYHLTLKILNIFSIDIHYHLYQYSQDWVILFCLLFEFFFLEKKNLVYFNGLIQK